jgi:hypothetical protein
MEKKITNNNIQFVADTLTDNLYQNLSTTTKDSITNTLKANSQNTSTNEDERVIESNGIIKQQSIKIIKYILIFGTIIVLLISMWKPDIDLSHLFCKNILLTLCVGAVELVFITFVISSYILADPNVVGRTVFNKLKN